MSNFYPANDAELTAWSSNLDAYAVAHLAALGLAAPDLAAFQATLAAYSTKLEAHITAQAAAEAATAAKKEARLAHEQAVRALANRIRGLRKATDADLEAMGLPVHDSSRTPVPAPATAPLVIVDAGERREHILQARDSGNLDRRGKPAGVLGAEVWLSVGEEPADQSQMQCVGLLTGARFIKTFGGTDAGKRAFYSLRWYNRRGEKGPWSPTVAATIAA